MCTLLLRQTPLNLDDSFLPVTVSSCRVQHHTVCFLGSNVSAGCVRGTLVTIMLCIPTYIAHLLHAHMRMMGAKGAPVSYLALQTAWQPHLETTGNAGVFVHLQVLLRSPAPARGRPSATLGHASASARKRHRGAFISS